MLGEPTSGLEDLTRALSSIGKSERHNLVEPGELDLIVHFLSAFQLYTPLKLPPVGSCPPAGRSIPYILENDKRAVDTADGVVPKTRQDRVGGGIARVAHGCDG